MTMDQITSHPSTDDVLLSVLKTWWMIRGGRGRVGGSTFLDFVIQYWRRRGRRVKPLDGDLRSRTFTALYPGKDASGLPMRDGATSPVSEDLAANKAWLGGELDDSVEDGVCRVVDFGGGDRVIQEYGDDIRIGDFCHAYSLGLIWPFILGPDPEDLQHVVQVIASGHVTGRILLVLNEGVIRHGQTTTGVFAATMQRPEYKALLRDGAEPFLMPRLTCMDQLRERGLGFYEAAAGGLDREGRRASPTMRHMVGVWIKEMEAQIEVSGAAQWMA